LPIPRGNPELVEFNAPITEQDGLDNEESTFLDGDVGFPGDKENEVVVHEGSDHDKDPNA